MNETRLGVVPVWTRFFLLSVYSLFISLIDGDFTVCAGFNTTVNLV